jgi:solute:Na+ symporter, SSS family
MKLVALDWFVIGLFFLISLLIGISAMRKAGKNAESFFLSGRNMPWWLLGISMVATTFSADTPNLVTDIVRKNGISGNWSWWAFLLTGMLTVFVYSRMWRRSGILTDLEFYELRYSGKMAAFLRAFRSVYLGVVFNVLIMATVLLAGIKMGNILLGLQDWQTLLLCAVVTVVYSTLGGLRGVLLTDFFQFFIAMLGSVWACYLIINHDQVSGLQAILDNENVKPTLNLIPNFDDPSIYLPIFLTPLLIQWWSVWYPGAEPGGGGYIAQRILASKDEKNALYATLLFNVAHYALRPWPWVLIALASLVVFPQSSDILLKFKDIDPRMVNDDLAYPAMISLLPKGVLGLVLASLIAALMSTLSTHLNWGASYITNDLYNRFINKKASASALVRSGRFSTILLMVLASIFALFLKNALQAFEIILQIGAGTGLLFIMRWFWWRINVYSELSAMIASFIFAIFLEFCWKPLGFAEIPFYIKIILSVSFTTVCWVLVTLFTPPESDQTLRSFYEKIRPHALGWKPFLSKIGISPLASGSISYEIGGMLLACVSVYGFLFSTGHFILGKPTLGIFFLLLSIVTFYILFKSIIPKLVSSSKED